MLADLDCFFVEVERLHRPELRGRAVVIGGRPDSRGVVAACSYEARALGIRSAMPMGEAYRLAERSRGDAARRLDSEARQDEKPRGGNVIFLHEGLYGRYSLYSQRVQDILRESVPVFKARSIDEFELELSGCERLFTEQYGGILGFAQHLRQRVRAEVGLPLSAGIGPSRSVAKMASRVAKPRDVTGAPHPGEPKSGVYRVLAEEAPSFLRPFDVQAVPGIGPVTAAQLRKMGISRVGQLLDIPPSVLRRVYGSALAQIQDELLGNADGWGDATHRPDGYFGQGMALPLPGERRPKSIGHETTLERDEIDPAVFEQTLWRLTEDACRRLRAADLRAAHVTVKLRYSDFDTHTHGAALPAPTDTEAGIFPVVLELFAQAHTRRLRVRLLGVRLERLSAGASQGALFETWRERREHALSTAVDRIRERFGRDTLLTGPGVHRLGKPEGQRHTMPTPGGFSIQDYAPQPRLPLSEAA